MVYLQEQYRGMEEILKKSLQLLKALARGNDLVQMRMFERLDTLLKIKVVESELAITLKEVSTGEGRDSWPESLWKASEWVYSVCVDGLISMDPWILVHVGATSLFSGCKRHVVTNTAMFFFECVLHDP